MGNTTDPQSTPLHRGANGLSRDSPSLGSHSHSEANSRDSYPWEGVEVSATLPPLMWQGGVAPLRKQVPVRGAPAGEAEKEGAGLVARGNQLPSNRLPLASSGPATGEGAFCPGVSWTDLFTHPLCLSISLALQAESCAPH